MKLEIEFDTWPLHKPFTTAGSSCSEIRTITVTISDGRLRGHGEALGVDYVGENADTMAAAILDVHKEIEAGVDCSELRGLLPPGGARNAVDCALWDLTAKRAGCRAWQLLGVDVQELTTVFTLSLDGTRAMAADAVVRAACPVLKVKLDEHDTADKIRAIRAARPDADIVIAANGSWTLKLLDELADVLLANRIDMVEQPLPAGDDEALEGNLFPIDLCADESCHSLADIEFAAERYTMINIKLDKCGGLTEAMRMVDWCRQNAMHIMVGNMLGSSLAMAPAIIPAQFCRYVDLDGPLLQAQDRKNPIVYRDAMMSIPDARLWG
ncbi:MAG TPA: dipeptide epimerase [Woeseiaceae bacterium]